MEKEFNISDEEIATDTIINAKKVDEILSRTYGSLKGVAPLIARELSGKVSRVIYTRDGLQVLHALTASKPRSTYLHSLYNLVLQYEKERGDGTTFLGLLANKLVLQGIHINKFDVDEVLEVLEDNSKQFTNKCSCELEKANTAYGYALPQACKCEAKDNFVNWIKTVASHSPFKERLSELFFNNRMTGNVETFIAPVEESVDTESVSGYQLKGPIHPYYLHPQFTKYTNYRILIDKRSLGQSEFEIYNDLGLKTPHIVNIVICAHYDVEVYEKISKGQSRCIFIKVPLDKSLEDLEDLIVFCGAKSLEIPEMEGVFSGYCNRIVINKGSIVFEEGNARKEDLNKHLENLLRIAKSKSGAKRDIAISRHKNLAESLSSKIVFCTPSSENAENFKEIVNDIAGSWRSLDYGYVSGSLNWILDSDLVDVTDEGITHKKNLPVSLNSNPLAKAIRELRQKIDTANFNSKVDLFKNIESAIVTAVSFANLINEGVPHINFQAFYAN